MKWAAMSGAAHHPECMDTRWSGLCLLAGNALTWIDGCWPDIGNRYEILEANRRGNRCTRRGRMHRASRTTRRNGQHRDSRTTWRYGIQRHEWCAGCDRGNRQHWRYGCYGLHRSNGRYRCKRKHRRTRRHQHQRLRPYCSSSISVGGSGITPVPPISAESGRHFRRAISSQQ